VLCRCYHRKLLDVRFNRVADAIAANDDLTHLQLTSGQQTERPKRLIVLLKPASFDCGIYEPHIIDSTPTTTSCTDEYWQQRLQQQQQQQRPVAIVTPVPLRPSPAAAAALRHDWNDSLQHTTANASTATTGSSVGSDAPVTVKKRDRWDQAVTEKSEAAAAAAAIDPATIRDSYDALQTAPTWGPNPYHSNVKQELHTRDDYSSSDRDVDRHYRDSKKRARTRCSMSRSPERRRHSTSRRSASRDRHSKRRSRSRRRSRSYSRARSRSSYYRR
jgi:hypothetical protein